MPLETLAIQSQTDAVAATDGGGVADVDERDTDKEHQRANDVITESPDSHASHNDHGDSRSYICIARK